MTIHRSFDLATTSLGLNTFFFQPQPFSSRHVAVLSIHYGIGMNRMRQLYTSIMIFDCVRHGFYPLLWVVFPRVPGRWGLSAFSALVPLSRDNSVMRAINASSLGGLLFDTYERQLLSLGTIPTPPAAAHSPRAVA